ncbi:LLM class F420-dependent oxidoreductase [Amycolatopsis saalfeldensis]|uniref:Probable F420-dependent oxidoreductase, Rv2161c family n=1 Tax=Amycolatopsis saalfeldensis TaxID=394193 RepID=A0A1H8YJE1_9PSEU|nr:LLM class F420-dependent oxidoreductase [Amycolatopsis saalfeldensis]SEP52267.1 probable F420-dependent oxidoreductase, Rv2161c family [Amycolatopsis saalfeldensis]
MKIGLSLPHLGAQATTENIRDFTLYAERNGWDSLWTGDRVLYPVEPKTPYPARPDGRLDPVAKRVFEHLTVLTYAAAVTERVRLGVSVLNLPFYNPVLLGRRLATLDQLSHGRLTVGVGLGWSADEFEAAGVPMRHRGRMTEEAVRALRAVWGPDPVEFSGEHYTIPPSIIGPKPVQDPLPILMGGFSPKALDRVGRLSDGFNPAAVPVGNLVDMRDLVHAAAKSSGREAGDLPTIVRANVALTPDGADLPEEGRQFTTGSWNQIAEDVGRLAAVGVDEVFFDLNYVPGAENLRTQLEMADRLQEICRAATPSGSGRPPSPRS